MGHPNVPPMLPRPLRSAARGIVIFTVLTTLLLGLGACAPTPDDSTRDPLAADLTDVGGAIRIDVDPHKALAVEVPGLGRITGPSGAFSSHGQIVVQEVSAKSHTASTVTAGGPGVDLTFQGTKLLTPLTILFDDPAVSAALPEDALPIVLHHPDGSPWEAKALDFTPDGVPYIVTKDFSPNVFSWITVPPWVNEIGDAISNWLVGTTEARECVGGGPSWAFGATSNFWVHLCTISNTDPSSGAVRAELQVQNNREYLQWVSVPTGNDYLWVADEPDLLRKVIGSITGHDPSREALLFGDGWMTAGYRQGAAYQEKPFRVYTDKWTIGFDILDEVFGAVPNDSASWAAIAVLAAQCSKFSPTTSTTDFLGCAISKGFEELKDPNKAFSAAMNIFGDKAYAQSFSAKLQSWSTRLNWLGRVIADVGIVLLSHTVLLRILDYVQSSSGAQSGTFTLSLNAIQVPRVPAPSAPTPVVVAPAPTTAPVPPPAPPSQPKAWVTRSGDTITYFWQDMPAGMWSQVDRFRCWRYPMATHPGGWATDGCGQRTGFAGFPSGTGSVSFTYGGANDSFSVEPWKYGPWLGVGESWQG